jgi:hypothetical protein
MASRVLVAAQTTPGSSPALQPGAGALAVGFQAADVTNFNYALLAAGKTYLLAMNTDASAHTVTVSSVVDASNRKGDITAYSLPAITGTTPVIAQFGPFQSLGWLTPTDGTSPAGLWFQASDATVKFAIVTLP